MEKIIRKYYGIILFYLVIVVGIIILNQRFMVINQQNLNSITTNQK